MNPNRYPVYLTREKLRVILDMIDSMDASTAKKYGLSQLEIADLYLDVSDAFDRAEDAEILNSVEI